MRIARALVAVLCFAASPALAEPTRRGLTFDAQLGAGSIRFDGHGTGAGPAMAVELGRWLAPRYAFTVRAAAGLGLLSYREDINSVAVGFAGPGVVWWAGPQLFVQGHAGIGAAVSEVYGAELDAGGIALELRGGAALGTGTNRFTLSFGVTPMAVELGDPRLVWSFSVLAGYRRL